MTYHTLKDIQKYYGQILKTNSDLKTSACCPLEAPPPRVQALLKNVHESVQSKFYGCGSPLPVAAEGCAVLDLGCGAGRDAFVLSQIVGKTGCVIGVDMTEEQLSVANQYIGWHMNRFGHEKPNVRFVKGYIEDLRTAGVQDESVDIVISNCVINLSPDKKSVFKEIHRVLKPGGELYFSDVFAGRRVPEKLQNDAVLRGECLGGAMYIEDFRRMMREIGILDYRTISKRQLTLDDPDIEKKAGMVD
ncbi:MAG: methyltransferase domain-containing protein, partial [Bdellovibrionales bacterium]